MSEIDFHNWLTNRLQRGGERVLIGAGADDCAHLDVDGLKHLAISTDTIVENTHFLADVDPLQIGWKAVACSLSDLAASGCRPLWGLVALTLRRGLGDRWAMRLMEGVISCAQRYRLTIVGGDTTANYGPTSVNITVAGVPFGSVAISRGGAKIGDVIAVTGQLGGSLLGKHLRPEPRFAEIEKLLEIAPIHACMDISDGLTLDLRRLLSASNAGAEIDETEIPISAAAIKMAAESGKSPLSHALGDGEDFELLFTVSEKCWEEISREWANVSLKTPVQKIGRVTVEQGIRLVASDGSMAAIEPTGYEHEF